MGFLAPAISIILLLLIILVPISLFISIKKRKVKGSKFLLYLFLTTLITLIIIFLFAWWGDYSNQLLLKNYGYNFDAMNDLERFLNVKSENIKRVKEIEISYYGIGWPLKALITYAVYFPYLLIVYLVGRFLTRKNGFLPTQE